MMPKTIDLATLTDAQLHIFYENALERGAIDLAVSIARELFRLGKLKRAELAKLRWNERAVAEILQPFADVARTVVRNSRTTYTNGGGLRRKPKADPERMMVDSYSAIKRGKINAAFAGRVKEPGQEPIFELRVNGQKRFYHLFELDRALSEWCELAEAA
jgi:hypothetical protein